MSLEGGLKLAWGEAGPLRNCSNLINNMPHIIFRVQHLFFLRPRFGEACFIFCCLGMFHRKDPVPRGLIPDTTLHPKQVFDDAVTVESHYPYAGSLR